MDKPELCGLSFAEFKFNKGSGDRYLNHLYTIKKWHVQQERFPIAESITLYWGGKQTTDFWVHWRLSALSKYLAYSNSSGARRIRTSFKTKLCGICLLPDGKSCPPSHQRIQWDPRSNHEAHILNLCILLQSQVWTNRTSLSGEIQEPACWRLGLFPHTASVYPSKPTQTSSGHLLSRIQMEQLAWIYWTRKECFMCHKCSSKQN